MGPGASVVKRYEAINNERDADAQFQFFCTHVRPLGSLKKQELGETIIAKGEQQDLGDMEKEAEFYTLAAKEAIYFLVNNTKKVPDPNEVKALKRFKDLKKKYKEDKDNKKKVRPEAPPGKETKWAPLRARLECKLKFKDIENFTMEDPCSSDDDEWKFTVKPGEFAIRKLVRDMTDTPDVKYYYKLKTKLKYHL